MELTHKTANYKILTDADGYQVSFYCAISNAWIHTSGRIRADTPEQALELAWKNEGKKHFNQCHKCGRWVSDVMYNADVLECVDCAPWEDTPNYCPQCGKRLTSPGVTCPHCGSRLRYEGGGCSGW